MGILDKIEQVAHGLMLFEGEKHVQFKVKYEDSKSIIYEVEGEYSDVKVVVSVGPQYRDFCFWLHDIYFTIIVEHEA